jgi:hypothetical protein
VSLQGGFEVSFAYTIIKDIAGWIRRQSARPIHWWRKRKFVEKEWNPTLDQINRGTEEIYSNDVLSESLEIVIRESDEQRPFQKFRKKIIFFVSDEEMKAKELENDKFVSVTKQIVRSRTSRFRSFLPSELRHATINVASESIIWDIRKEAIDDFYEESETMDTEEQLETKEKVEQMVFAGEYDDFCRQVIVEHKGQKSGPRIQKMVGESFERSFAELQKSFRGIIYQISKTKLKYHQDGLKGLILPYNAGTLPRYDDAHAFLWVHPTGILVFANIETITKGMFDDLWQLYCKSHCTTKEVDLRDMYNIMTNWVKGYGGKKGKKSRGKIPSGEGLQISFALLGEITELKTPIDKGEFRKLTRSRLTDFAKLTQKQVNSLIQRGR